MDKLLQLIGINAIGVGLDFNCFAVGIKYEGECTLDDEEGTDVAAFFIFLGPVHVIFVLE